METELTRSESIDNFYMLCELCQDNYEYITFLLHIPHIRARSYEKTELEYLRPMKFDTEIELLLSNLSKQDFRNLLNLFNDLQDKEVQTALRQSKLCKRVTSK